MDTFPFGVLFFIHRYGQLDVARVGRRLLPACAAAGTGYGQWDHADLTYLQVLSQLAATAHDRIAATIHAIAQLRVPQSARTAMSPMSRPSR